MLLKEKWLLLWEFARWFVPIPIQFVNKFCLDRATIQKEYSKDYLTNLHMHKCKCAFIIRTWWWRRADVPIILSHFGFIRLWPQKFELIFDKCHDGDFLCAGAHKAAHVLLSRLLQAKKNYSWVFPGSIYILQLANFFAHKNTLIIPFLHLALAGAELSKVIASNGI